MLRTLKTSDIFKMSKILKKMGLKNELKVEEDKTVRQTGAEFVLSVFENLHQAETEVNEFLADLSGFTSEEFAALPIEETFKILNEFRSMKGIFSFFKLANQ